MNAVLIKKILSKWGVTTEHVVNGIMAVEHTKKKKYDYILMDLHMPELNGLDATRMIRKPGNLNANTPVFAITADVMTSKNKETSLLFNKVLWKPLQILGFSDPTSPAQNWKERIKVEHKLEKWIQENNNQMMITGHTHRPRFPDKNEIPFFNDGSCVHPRSITGIEIENNKICLIKWHIITLENGTLQIQKTILEGPESLTHYMN